MKSAIGEKLTRKDHGDVSNQLYAKVSRSRALDCVPQVIVNNIHAIYLPRNESSIGLFFSMLSVSTNGLDQHQSKVQADTRTWLILQARMPLR